MTDTEREIVEELKRYASHLPSCEWAVGGATCDCGLFALLDRIRSLPLPAAPQPYAIKARDAEWQEAIVPGNSDSDVGRKCSTPQGAAEFLRAHEDVVREQVEYTGKIARRYDRLMDVAEGMVELLAPLKWMKQYDAVGYPTSLYECRWCSGSGSLTPNKENTARHDSDCVYVQLLADFATLRASHPELFAKEDGDGN